jgi:hypothetical protein
MGVREVCVGSVVVVSSRLIYVKMLATDRRLWESIAI